MYHKLEELIGAQVTGAERLPGGEGFQGLEFTLPDGSIRFAVIQCDPEGNGPGWLNIQCEGACCGWDEE